jgi:hypothetical protein
MVLIHSKERCSVAKLTPASTVSKGAIIEPVKRLLAIGMFVVAFFTASLDRTI